MTRFLYLPILATILFLPLFSQAASLYIDPPKSTLFRGDAITLSVRVDTDEEAGECINAVDGVLTYSSNLQPVDVSIGKSIFNIWVEQPVINTEDRTITFAGGIPNGYCGRVDGDPRLTNVLTEIVFRSPSFSVTGSEDNDNIGVVSFADSTTVYLNDGRGTVAPLETYSAEINLEKETGPTQRNDWKQEVNADRTPPEEFSISLQKDENAFSQRYYIVFNTTDKQTGIDQYQVIEEPLSQFGSFQWGRADAPWLTQRSPYVLKDQSLNSVIRVKAIDKAGNEYIASLVPDDSLRTVSGLTIALYVLGVSLLVLMAVAGFFVFRFIKKRATEKEAQTESEELSAEDDNE